MTDIMDDSIFEEYRQSEYVVTTDLLTSRTITGSDLPDDQLLLLPPRVYGHSLLDRQWVAFNVGLLREISPEDS